ncbi:thiamine phosphate synthase [Sphingomonas hominis]|nr:thiamine phosphate synthase [Sphingomonas hominis]
MDRCHPDRSRRTPLPMRWLMTDERMGEGLWRALERLPRGGGVVFRHYTLPSRERRGLFARVRRVALRRGLVLVRAGPARMTGEMGTHAQRGAGMVTWPVHDVGEARGARRARVDAVFVSPVFATRSHPGATGLGARRARAIGRVAGVPVIALGGMSEARFRRLRGFHGYAAIDAWSA